MNRAGTVHIPVLFHEVIEALQASNGGTFLDCTIGGGGHLEGILNASPKSNVIGIDRDKRAVDFVGEKLSSYGDRCTLKHMPFSQVLGLKQHSPFDGVIADFGLCSDQLDESRGFSFRDSTRLDMRMDETSDLTAYEVVNDYDPKELSRMFSRGGVTRNVKRYVAAIVDKRPIETTAQLAAVLSHATPMRDQKDIHPATIAFQAIRIEVNGELREIEILLDTIPDLMEEGGRLVCISFHSLEDELVTKRMRKWQGEAGPANWPGGEALSRASLGVLLTRKATLPTKSEVTANPRSRSAKMRVFEFH